MTDKNFGLTEEDFLSLVNQLKKGEEALFEKIFLSQFDNSLKNLMRKYKSPREVAYDVCMDSLIYFRKLLINDKLHYGNLRALFNQVTSQKYIKHVKKQQKLKLTDEVPEIMGESTEDKEHNLSLLSAAWERLGEECKQILKDYYYSNQKLYDIAETLGKSPAAIRKQKERCINALRLNFRQTV